MLQTVVSAAALAIIGFCIFVRRRSWRAMPWDRVITLALVLQLAAFFLVSPFARSSVGRWLFALTRVAHMRDFFGHLCFICAMASIIYACAGRLLPDDQVEKFMRRVEVPSSTAALAMLICIMSSRSTKRMSNVDFLDVEGDAWLKAYWVIYAAITVHLGWLMLQMLLALRQDHRSRATANAYIAAVFIGTPALPEMIWDDFSPPQTDIPAVFVWMPVVMSCTTAAVATALSWGRRTRRPVWRDSNWRLMRARDRWERMLFWRAKWPEIPAAKRPTVRSPEAPTDPLRLGP